ncbi:MAG: virB7 [Rhizobium sp.]|nr:virB7 [Rhizobium sp.]
MIKTVSLLFMAATLSGCASLTYPLPKCDGYTRRPLNRAMWQWEDNSNLKQKRADIALRASSRLTTAYIEADEDSSAFTQFDSARSYRRCEA